jgi:Fic family protein
MKYNWQQKDWPNFQYQTTDIEDLLLEFAERSGRMAGLVEGFTESSQTETLLRTMISEAIKSSEIEGEFLNRKDVASSIRRNLGLDPAGTPIQDKKAEGIAELMITVRNTYEEALSADMLFSWHILLMKGNPEIDAGRWRSHEEPMQIVSGTIGKEKVHFEAPPSNRVPGEMDRLINWFNDTAPSGNDPIKKPIIRAAITHAWFESIHPFEDGNGRIGRALSEKALSQERKVPLILSLSTSIEAQRKEYYAALQKMQQCNEITPWINYFVKTALGALNQAELEVDFTLRKTRFFDLYDSQMNARQLKAIRRMLDEGPGRFEGGMNARKYISLTKTSKATATRDLQDLAKKKILLPSGGGRSTHYKVNI